MKWKRSTQCAFLHMSEAHVNGRRDGSVVRNIGCSSRGPGLESQHPHGGLQPPVTPFSGDGMPSSGFCRHQASKWDTDMHADKIPILIKLKLKTRKHTRGKLKAGEREWIVWAVLLI